MKCPKCHYLSFDPEPRCRNCGHDLAGDTPESLRHVVESDSASDGLEVFAAESDVDVNGVPAAAPEPDLLDPNPSPRRPARTRDDAPRASRRRQARQASDARAGEPEHANPAVSEGGAAPRTSELPLFVTGRAGAVEAPPADETVSAAAAAEFFDPNDPDRAEETPAHPEETPEPVLEAGAEPAVEAPMLAVEESAADQLAIAEEPLADLPIETVEPSRVENVEPAAPLPAAAGFAAALDQMISSDVEDADDLDLPLVQVPAEPRAPLAVRREVADARPARAVPRRKLGPLDRDLLEDLQRLEKAERKAAAREARNAGYPAWNDDAPSAVDRLGAAAIDAIIATALSGAVLAITLRWCDLPFAQVGTLPLAPTVAFLLLVCVGYLLMFTAAVGQTIGKMALGLRVVAWNASEPAAPLTVRQALVRECLAVPSVLLLGIGLIPGLVGHHLAVHDRLSHTRVVRQ